MKNKLKLQIDLNSPSRRSLVKTPDILRKRDYSPMPIDSPNSIKHRVSVIEVKKEYQECDSPEEVQIEDLVNYIFESSSYKDKMWVIYPEEHKYAGQQRPLNINS